jgi:hypothetical protein
MHLWTCSSRVRAIQQTRNTEPEVPRLCDENLDRASEIVLRAFRELSESDARFEVFTLDTLVNRSVYLIFHGVCNEEIAMTLPIQPARKFIFTL